MASSTYVRFLFVLTLAGALGISWWPRAARAQPGPGQGFRNRATDSLRAVLRNPALPDTQRVLTLFSLEQEYHMNDDATALRIARQALAMARKQKFVRGELMVLSDLARATANAQDLVQAERWAQELQRRVAQAPPGLQRFRIVALQTLANVAVAQGNTTRALGYLRQALSLLYLVANRPSSDFPLLTYYGLSVVYIAQVKKAKVPADSLVRQARYYTARFAELARRMGRVDMLAEAYSSLGELSTVSQADSSFSYYFGRAAQLSQAVESRYYEAFTRRMWAEAAQRQRQYPLALAQARQAVGLARAVHEPVIEAESREVLAAALATTGRGLEAYLETHRARQLHDSTDEVNNRKELQKLQVRFDTERQANQIAALKQQQKVQQAQAQQQRQRLWTLGVVLGVVALAAAAVGVLALRLRRSRAQLAAQHLQLAAQNEELSHTRAAQDRLYALVAHDLRSPVVAFAGLADLLNRYVQRQDTQRLAGLGERIRQAALGLSELLDNLLNWALSQRGELTPQLQALRVKDLLVEAAALYSTAAEAADVTIELEADADLLVQADANMTRTILRNLVGNALRATPVGGRVRLVATLAGTAVSLQVLDTGAGLNPAVLAQLEAGLRVAEQGRGAGLGLVLSRSFAQAQGGALALRARPEAGTEAQLLLPRAHPVPVEAA